MALPIPANLAEHELTAQWADIATASNARICVPYRCRIERLYVTPDAQLTGANTVITPSLVSAGTATQWKLNGSNTTLTIATNTNAGVSTSIDVSSSGLIANEGDTILLASDGGATNAGAVLGFATVLVTALGGG